MEPPVEPTARLHTPYRSHIGAHIGPIWVPYRLLADYCIWVPYFVMCFLCALSSFAIMSLKKRDLIVYFNCVYAVVRTPVLCDFLPRDTLGI